MDFFKVKIPRIDKLAFDQIKKMSDTRMENKIVKRGHIADLESRIEQLQNFIIDDVLTARQEDATYKSNAYPSYSSAVAAIIAKYNGTADWGVFQTGNIIDLRAAFIISEGINLVEKEDAPNELEFAEAFLDYNNLDKEVAQDFAKEAEIEGKILLKLAWEKDPDDEKKGMVTVRFIPWNENKYKIEVGKEDYTDYVKATWKPFGRSSESQTLKPEEFVYAKFGGRISKPNEAAPKIMKCLTQIENLDRAIRDWREINRLFSAPTPHFECETKEQATFIMQQIEQNPNFKIKKMLAHTGKFGFAGPDIRGMTSLEDEITMNAKMVSGATGVPVHFLGLPDLLSNRATAENLMQLVVAATSKERQIWRGVYEELLHKAMIMYNKNVLKQRSNAKKLDPDKIGVEIPLTMESEWLHFQNVWLPLWLAGKITDELALSKLPGCDVKAELERQEEGEKSEADKLRGELDKIKAEQEEAAAIEEAGMTEPEEVLT